MNRTLRIYRNILIAATLTLAIGCAVETDEAAEDPVSDPSDEVEESADDDPEAQETITLTVADSNPPAAFPVIHGIQPWMERVTELTDGQVTFDYFPAQQLGAELDLLTMVRGGTADIGFIPTAFFAGEMPLSEILTLPGLFTDSTIATQAFIDATMNTEIHEHDWSRNNVRLLFGAMLPQYNVITADAEVARIEDLAGLTLKTGGSYQNRIVEELGAIPSELPTPETYQALQLGTLDGAIFPVTQIPDFSLDEVVCCVSMGWNLSTFFLPYAINEDVWVSLPDHVQEAMNAASEEVIPALGEELDGRTSRFVEQFEDSLVLVTISEDESQRVNELLAGIRQEWVDDVAQYGVDGQAILDYLEARVRELEVETSS